jgi:ParB family chromosome partitioning protein
MTEKILIAQISASERIRKDLGDLEPLKQSMLEHGLLQSIGVRPTPEAQGFYQVIWGGRRFESAKQLGWEEIECKIISCDEDYDLREKELEENIRRKDMTWQEQAMSLHEIHRLKVSRNALIGEKWGYRETGHLLGISLGNVSYALEVAKKLRAGDEEMAAAPNFTEALRILVRRKEAELQTHKGTLVSKPTAPAEDIGFSQDDLIKMQDSAKAEVEAAAPVGSMEVEVLWYDAAIAQADLVLMDSDDVVRYGETLKDTAQILTRLVLGGKQNAAFGDRFLVVYDETSKPDDRGFKNGSVVFAYSYGSKSAPPKVNMTGFYSANGGGAREITGQAAEVANTVWRIVLPGLVKPGATVFIASNLYPVPMAILSVLGYRVLITPNINTDYLETQANLYGIPCIKKDNR